MDAAFYLANRGNGTVQTEQIGLWCNLATADRGGRRGDGGGESEEKGEMLGPAEALLRGKQPLHKAPPVHRRVAGSPAWLLGPGQARR